MASDLNLNAMNTFESVARLGRVSRAAEELGVSPSAVSQQIKLLEQQSGVLLFRRERQRLTLTYDGERLFRVATQAFAMVRDVQSAIVRQRQNRHFILRVSPSFGVRWLGPRLADFIDAHDEWHIRIDATPDFSEFDTEVVDLDLRYGRGGWAGLHEEAVVDDCVLPMCSPAYLDRMRARADDPHDQLRQARLIDSVKTYYRWDFWLTQHAIMGERMAYPMRFDRSSMAIQLAKDDAGVVLESATLCANELADGSLVPFSPSFEVITFPAYWLVSPPRHFNRRIVKIFAEWMHEEGRRHDVFVRALLAEKGCTLVDASQIDGMPQR